MSLPSSPPTSGTDRQLPSAERFCSNLVRTVGILALLMAASNLVMWWIPSLRFMATWPGAMVMRANTGLSLAFLAMSLLMWHQARREHRPAKRIIAAAFGGVAMLIGGITSLEHFVPALPAIDTLFAVATFPEDAAHRYVVVPGRMSLNAALSIFFLGLALTGVDWKIRFKERKLFTSPIFAVISALPVCFGLVGYLSGSTGFTGLLKSTNVLMHVAASLVLLAIGTLALRSERQPVQRILSQGAGGTLLRWLLPGSTVSLIFLAWLVGKGRMQGVVEAGEGTAFMLFGGLVLLYALIVSASRAVSVQEARARHARSALRGEEQRSRSILKTSLDGVLIVDIEGRIVDWNQAAERIFGWPREEVIGKPLVNHVVPERLRAAYLQRLENYLPSRENSLLGKRLELPALRRDGSEFPVEVSINAVSDARPPLFVGFVRDITHRQKAEKALREAKEHAEKASQAKDEFLAALSHELRTPLTPVLLTASHLAEDERLPEDVRESLTMIDRHVTLEARLIDDLLDLTRISSGKLRLRSETCDLHELLQHTLVIVQEEARHKELDLVVEIPSRAQPFQGDPARLQQVFWNLLKNAIKFTPAGGQITLSARHDADTDRFIITVSDTGVGFAPERAEHLFLPFEQDKSEAAHQFGGLGLGLAIARALVELHQGVITASSPGLGLGATFTVTLPVTAQETANVEETPSDPPTTSSAPASTRRYRILLVEDHAPTRQILTQLLKRNGHEVFTAGSLAEALESSAHLAPFPNLLISDLGLPDGSGLDLLTELRRRGHHLPAIALSGYGMEEDHQRTQAAGFAAHLVKPVKFAQLQQVFEEVL